MPSPTRHRPPVLLELDLTQPLVDAEPDDPIAKLRSRGKPRLRPVVRALYEAADDAHVAGLVVKVGDATMPLARAQELREALRAFAGSGKPAVAWAETFGEAGSGTVPYFLATGCPQVWLQPSGGVNLLGVAAEVTFVRGALDKLGVEPELDQRHEYKNAADRILRTGFTDPHREALDRLTDSAWEQVVAGVAAARGLSADEVRAAADDAPLSAEAARSARLVDRLAYRDEIYADVRRECGGDVRLLFAERWTPSTPRIRRLAHALRRRSAPGLALVDGHGPIVGGRSRRLPLQGQAMGSDTVAAAMRAAVRDEKVRGIVFRVDSPGGSYVASDTVWREVLCAREAGKPVVVSMGAVAGSGGYFVSCPADVIVAEPGTITGSIGVFGGKPVTTGLTDRVGLAYDAVQRGANARMFSTHRGFDDEQWVRLRRWLDEVYADFVAKVARGRGMTPEAVHHVARGRVWTGADAVGIGLVDELGGLHEAAALARRRAGLPADAPLRPAVSVSPVARLKPPRSSDDPRAAAGVGLATAWTDGWGRFAALAAQSLLPAAGPLTMPVVVLR